MPGNQHAHRLGGPPVYLIIANGGTNALDRINT
jgi:hypothetical protein